MHKMALSRRTFLVGTALAGGGLLAGCGTGQGAPDEKVQEAEDDAAVDAVEQEESPTGASRAQAAPTLVVFYSRADENYGNGGIEVLEVGHTKVMAGYIAEALGADSYEITPVEAYPYGYDDCCDQAAEEQRADARPAIAGDLPNVSGYGTVFIGCPIWWGEEPMIVRTFLDAVELSGKTIVPFTTHGGSGLGNIPSNLQARIPEATFLEAKAVPGIAVDGARDEVVSWAKGLGV